MYWNKIIVDSAEKSVFLFSDFIYWPNGKYFVLMASKWHQYLSQLIKNSRFYGVTYILFKQIQISIGLREHFN